MQYEFKEQDAWDFARHIGVQPKPRGDELHFLLCPYCRGGKSHDKYTFSINLKTGQFKCMRDSCGITGNMVTLAKDFNFDLGGEFGEYLRPKKKYRKLKTPEKPIEPKPNAIAYMNSRGISEEICKKYELTVQTEHDNILVFPFYDQAGHLQFVKYRKTDFDKERDKNKEWCEPNCRPILFGMKQCVDFGTLIISEGMIDSLSISEAGIPNAVSVPTGAKGFTWIPYCWDWVRQFEEIVVFGDYEKGHMTLLDDIKARFPNKMRAVQTKDYLGCKDANEILQKFGKEAVRAAVKNAKLLPVKRVVNLADVESVNTYKLPRLKTKIKPLDIILSGGLFFGQLDIIGGKRGDGKSTFASEIMAHAIDQGFICFVYSGELLSYQYKRWMDFQIAGPRNIVENYDDEGYIQRFITNSVQEEINSWYNEKIYIYDSTVIEDEEEDLPKTIEESIMQYGVQVILIDNLMTAIALDSNKDRDKYNQQSRFVDKLRKIALKYNVLILLVAHRRKNGFADDANDEISGSADITNMAGIVMSYDRDKELPQTQRKLILSKSRLVGKLNYDGYILEYDEKSKRIYSSIDELNYQYGWERNRFIGSQEGDVVFK